MYVVDDVEFDGFSGGVLLEAKGPGYRAFFDALGNPQHWYRASGKFDELMSQASNQAKVARGKGLPLRWHVAEPEVAEFLRRLFKVEEIRDIDVVHTPPVPREP